MQIIGGFEFVRASFVYPYLLKARGQAILLFAHMTVFGYMLLCWWKMSDALLIDQISSVTGKSSLTIQFVEGQFVDSYDPTIENSKFVHF